MGLSFAQLSAPIGTDAWRTLILGSLQGLGIVSPSGTGGGSTALGTGSVTLSGTPAAAYPKTIIQITTAGEQGAAVFQYSLNAGISYTTGITIPASPGAYLIPTTGVTATFNSGPSGAGTSFAVGDTFSFALSVSPLSVTSWQSGGAFRTLTEILAQALADLSLLLSAIAAGGMTTSSTGAWLDLLAANLYLLTRNIATYSKGVVQLVVAAGSGPYTVPAGGMWFADAAGHRFNNTAAITAAGTLTIPVNATFTTGVGTLATATYYYRVTATNAQGETLPSAETSLAIAGPLGVNVNWTAVTGATGYKVYGRTTGVELLIAAVVGGGTVTYLDGGSITPAGALPTANTSGTLVGIPVQAELAGSAYNVANNAITIIQAGTLPGVTVNNPDPGTGTWVTTSGADPETDAALVSRCQARWPALSQSAGTAAVYDLWAKSSEAAAGHGTTITRTLVQPDVAIAGRVNVYLATATNIAGTGAVTDANTYIQARIPLVSTAVVAAATAATMTTAGTVNYFSSKTTAAAVQAAVQTALQNYIAGVAIGIDAAGTVKVYWSEIEAVCGSATGVRNVIMTLNAASTDVALTTGQVAVSALGSITYAGVTA